MKYYAMVDEKLCGPFEAEALTTLDGFTRRTLVQSQDRLDSGHPRWSEAGDVPLLAVLMDMRDRPSGRERYPLVRDAFGVGGGAKERDMTGLAREVAQSISAQRSALDGARSELERIGGRLGALEGALRGIRTAVYCAVAAVGLVGLLWVMRPRSGAGTAPSLPPVVPLAPAVSSVAAARAAPPPRAAAAPARPERLGDESREAIQLVRDHTLPAPARCPRTAAEARAGLGALARTPPHAAACAAMERVMSLYDALVGELGWTEEKAVGLLDRAVREKGGLDAAFPPYSKARRLAGRTYSVELGRRDQLTPALSVLLDSDFPAGVPIVIRYEADLDSGAVRRPR